MQYSAQLVSLHQKVESEALPQDQITNIVKTVKNNLGKSSTGGKVQAVAAIRNTFDAIDKTAKFPTSVNQYNAMFGAYRFDSLAALKTCEEMGALGNKRGNQDFEYKGGGRDKRGRGKGQYSDRPQTNYDKRPFQKKFCFICNGGAHAEGACRLFNHPDGNHEQRPFEQSTS
jgi:hypothetical protein